MEEHSPRQSRNLWTNSNSIVKSDQFEFPRKSPNSLSVQNENVPKSDSFNFKVPMALHKPMIKESEKSKENSPISLPNNLQDECEKLKKWFKLNDTQKRIQTEKINQVQETCIALTKELNNMQSLRDELQFQLNVKHQENEECFEKVKIMEDVYTSVVKDAKKYDEKLQACENLKLEMERFHGAQLEQIMNLSNEFEKLEVNSTIKIMTLEHSIVDLDAERNRLVNDFNKEIQTLNYTIKALKAVESDNCLKINQLTYGLEQEKEQVKILIEERDALQSDVNYIKHELASITEEFDAYKDLSDQKNFTNEEEIKEMKATELINKELLVELKSENEKLKNELESEIQKIFELGNIANNKEDKILALEQDILTLRTKLQDETDDHAGKLAKLQDHVQQLQEKNTEYKKIALKAVKKYEKLKMLKDTELSLIKNENKDLRQQIDNLHLDIQKEVDEKGKLFDQCEHLRKEMMETLETCKADYQVIVSEKDAKIANLGVELTDEINKKDKIIKTNKETLTQLRTDFEKSKATLFAEKDSADQKVLLMENKYTELKNVVKDKDLADQKVLLMEKQYAELKNVLKEKEEQIETLKASQKPIHQVVTTVLKKTNSSEVKKSVTFSDSVVDIIPSTDTSTECMNLEIVDDDSNAVETNKNRITLRSAKTHPKSFEISTKLPSVTIDLKRKWIKNDSKADGSTKKSKSPVDSSSGDAPLMLKNCSVEESKDKYANIKNCTTRVGNERAINAAKKFFKRSSHNAEERNVDGESVIPRTKQFGDVFEFLD